MCSTVAPLLSLCALAAVLAAGSAIQCYVNDDWSWEGRPWEPFNVGKATLQQCEDTVSQCHTEEMTVAPHWSDMGGQIHRGCGNCDRGENCEKERMKVVIDGEDFAWNRCCCCTDGCNRYGLVVPSKQRPKRTLRKRCLSAVNPDVEETCDDAVSHCLIKTVKDVTSHNPNVTSEALRKRWAGTSLYGCDRDSYCAKYGIGEGHSEPILEKDNYTLFEYIYYCCTPDKCNKAVPSRKRCLSAVNPNVEEICDEKVSHCRITTVKNVTQSLTTGMPNTTSAALRRRWVGTSKYGCDNDQHCVKYNAGDGDMKTVLEKVNFTMFEYMVYCCKSDRCNTAGHTPSVSGAVPPATGPIGVLLLLSLVPLVIVTADTAIMSAGNFK